MSHNPFWDPNLVYSVVIDNGALKTLGKLRFCLTICKSWNYVHFWQKNRVSALKIA
jgi:hypothetical protein